MVEVPVHIWRNRIDGTVMVQIVGYNVGGYVPSSLPRWVDTMNNTPRIPPVEVVYTEEVGDNGKPFKRRLEQKSFAVLKNLVAQYRATGRMFLSLFCRTVVAAKECLSLSRHMRCVCGDIDEDCVTHGLRQLVEVFARQLLNSY